jgi:hypothetical protein
MRDGMRRNTPSAVTVTPILTPDLPASLIDRLALGDVCRGRTFAIHDLDR